MKTSVVGTATDIARIIQNYYDECAPFQWAREALENARNAFATRFEILPEPTMQLKGTYLAMLADNGHGMTGEELLESFSRPGYTVKEGHFGVGIRVSTLPWNHNGVLVISYKNGEASVVLIRWNALSKSYDFFRFEDGVVGNPETAFITYNDQELSVRKMVPAWVREAGHGTVLVLLGSKKNVDTLFGAIGRDNEKGKSYNGVRKALNTRYFDLSDMERVGAYESLEAYGPVRFGGIPGVKHFLEAETDKGGKLAANGHLLLDNNRVRVDWYIRQPKQEGGNPWLMSGSYGINKSFLGLRYENELYSTFDSTRMGQFGISGAAQKFVVLIVTPQPYADGWGVRPGTARDRLTFTKAYRKQDELPMSDWGQEFQENLPAELVALNRASVARVTKGILSHRVEELLGKVYARFNSTVKETAKMTQDITVSDPGGDRRGTGGDVKATVERTKPSGGTGGGDGGAGGTKPVKPTKTEATVLTPGPGKLGRRTKTGGGGSLPNINITAGPHPVKSYYVATWNANGETLDFYPESPFVQVHIQQAKKEDPSLDAVKVVGDLLAQLVATKVVHVYETVKDQAERDDLLTPAALTVSISGLLAEDTFLALQLAQLKKAGTP